MSFELDVRVTRGAAPESRHRVQAAVSDTGGRVIEGTGQPHMVTTWRSAAKPFQLLPMIERGHAERWRLGDEHLAMMAASHIGSPEHVRWVRDLLERTGGSVTELACGFHEPADPVSLEFVRSHPEERTALYNNCSGKHAGMVATCRAEGWPVDGYHHAEHPLQGLVQRTVSETTGVPERDLLAGIDGCGLPVFGLPLSAMALAYARFAVARRDGEPRARALARIRDAMTRHPHLTEGHDRFSSELMAATGGRLVAKSGAEGLECIGWPERGIGIALKCEDGAMRAIEPATVALLDRLGALDATASARLERFRRPVVTNVVGLEVGRLEARLETASSVV